MTDREAFEAAWGAKYVSQSPEEDEAWYWWQAALAAQQKSEPVGFVERAHISEYRKSRSQIEVYTAPPLDPEGIRLLREAREWVISNGECAQDAADLRDGIDAYLAKYPGA